MKNIPDNPQLIDIDNIIRNRESKMLRLLRPLISGYIKKVVHQDEINDFLKRHYRKSSIEFIRAALYEKFTIQEQIINEHKILPDPSKRYIYVANHPLGGLDGIFLIYKIYQKTGSAKAIINDLLLNIENLKDVFIGVNLYGFKSRETIKEINDTFKSDQQIVIFPAGLVSRRQNKVIKDLPWKGFFVKQAIKYKRDVIPIHITGRLTNFFYNFANFRKKIGIKSNIELFYLPDELFKQKNQKLTMTVGDPVPYETFDESRSHEEWAHLMREHVYELSKDKDAHFKNHKKK